jgi:hypothetical protein
MGSIGKTVIAGGSGLVGRALAGALVEAGVETVVLTRRIDEVVAPRGARVVAWGGGATEWRAEIDGAGAVVNLCGENIAAGRWTAAKKRRLASSRIEPARALAEAIGAARGRPRVYLQASATGYFGARDARPLDESAPPGSGFLSELCAAWEGASAGLESLGVRRVLARLGVVLAREGGALAKMLPIFRLGIAGPLGDGRQWFSWIHLVDAVAALRFLLRRDDLAGAFHLTAPAPVDNRDFTRVLARAVRRPAVLPVPRIALRLLYGELGDVLLTGQRVVPRRLLEAGFEFRFPELDGALAALLPRAR